MSKWLLAGIALAILILDQATKLLTRIYLPEMDSSLIDYPYGGIPIFKQFLGVQFSIHHVVNHGAAWGVFAQFQKLLLVVRIFLILGLAYYAVARNKEPSWRIPLLLIITGASCNVLDTFLYGHVIDMFHFTFWGYNYPVFNIADAAVCIGVFWLAILNVCTKSVQSHG